LDITDLLPVPFRLLVAIDANHILISQDKETYELQQYTRQNLVVVLVFQSGLPCNQIDILSAKMCDL
jgi:hypothetical protein